MIKNIAFVIFVIVAASAIPLGFAFAPKPQGAAGPNRPYCACSDAGMQAIECRMANEPCDNR